MKTSSIVLILGILLVGCSSLSQPEAESIARAFIETNVGFFATQEEEQQDLPDYEIARMTSYQEGSDWIVIMHVTATIEGETKQNDLTLRLDRTGKPIEFMGRPLP